MHWRLKPTSAAVVTTRKHADRGAMDGAADIVLGHTIVSNFTKLIVIGRNAEAAVLNSATLQPYLRTCMPSLLLDCAIHIEGRKIVHVLSRNDGAQVYCNAEVCVVGFEKSAPAYLIEPWTASSFWNKLAGHQNQSFELASTDVLTLNLSPEILKTTKDIIDEIFSNSNSHHVPSLLPTHNGESRSKSMLVISNDLGADIRMWISGAWFLEEDGQLDIEDASPLEYTQQVLVLAGTSVTVVFMDPLSSVVDLSKDCLEGVSVTIEVEGWSEVEQIEFVRQGVVLYSLESLSNEPCSTTPIKDWRSLSDSSINETHASPLVRWKDQRADETSTSEDITHEIFATDLQENVSTSPFALKVECSSVPVSSGALEINETINAKLTSNIFFKNDSGSSIDVLCRDDIQFEDNIHSLETGQSMVLPLPVLREGSIRYTRHNDKAIEVVHIPIIKELLDLTIPQVLRRSVETDTQATNIHPIVTPELKSTSPSRLSVWEFSLAPSFCFRNVTAWPIVFQVLQPPHGRCVRLHSLYSHMWC
jgi:hypothetical protein